MAKDAVLDAQGRPLREKHEVEQYFYDQATRVALAEWLRAFDNPCLLCAPSVGVEALRLGRQLRVLDLDRRFGFLPGYQPYDLYRPAPLDETFDLIFCDPPFFGVKLSQLFAAIRLLARFDLTTPVAMGWLARRGDAVLGTFHPFGLRATGIALSYLTIDDDERNRVELYTNLPEERWPQGV
jgi:hypothetical protein